MPIPTEPALSTSSAPPIWLLALITLSGTLAMHIFVPALPAAARELGATPASMQLTISGYILGLAVGQLAYGPLADRFGRRPILMVGLVLYTIAGIACVYAETVAALVVARVVQALGGCAGMVLGRAMVRDSAAGGNAIRRMALVNLLVTAGPGLAPLIGGALAASAGWRAIFMATCALGLVNLVLTWGRLSETAHRKAGTDARLILTNYGRLLKSPRFLCYAVGGSFATTSWYAFVSAAPFIYVDQLHRPQQEVGLHLSAIVMFLWLGSVLASRFALKSEPRKLLAMGTMASLVGALLLLLIAVTGALSIATISLPMCMFALGVGIAAAPALVEAVSVNTTVIGSSSGLYGFVQMVIGAICASAVGIGHNPALATACILVVAMCLASILLRSAAGARV